MKLLRLALLPLSLVYGSVLWLRNKLYDWGLLSSRSGNMKTIVVGNLALGGTGKTPFIEYLVKLFPEKHIAVLSRGYGRKTQGTIFAEPSATAEDIGDEPLQIIQKFPKLTLCVEADRIKGIEAIKAQKPNVDLVILDDAFQHRKLRGGLNILLTTYQKPFFKDFYIPSGTLRDHKIRARDADVVIVTKTPEKQNTESIKAKLNYLDKPIFFSHLEYGEYQSLCKEKNIEEFEHYAAVTGIANSNLFIDKISGDFLVKKHFRFPDHHAFSESDFEVFRDFIGNFAAGKVAFITTEKDAMRLLPFKQMMKSSGLNFFYLPVQVGFKEKKANIDMLLRNYIHGTQ